MARKILLAVVVALAAGSVAATPGAPLDELLAAAGIRPLSPPPAAPDFTLPLFDGGQGSLSDHQGEWVLLTFFATWCAPCRSELPTLERLHRERPAAGPAVVAVSVDRSPEPLAPFVEQLGLTLPVFWDRGGEVGATWGAGSIPVSYLIDPGGQVVGLARGARDWAAAAPLFAELARRVPAAPDAPSRYARLDRLELPGVADPPTAGWSLPVGELRPGRPFTLEVNLRWSGRIEDYLPRPPRLTLPEGITEGRVAASSSSRDRDHVVRYAIELTADEPGFYALDPIELGYLPALGGGAMATRVAGPTVEVAGAGLAAGWPLALALAALAGVALAAGRAWRRARRGGPDEHTAPPWERLRGELERAKALRLAGDAAAAYETLVAAAAELEEPEARRDLDRRLEAVRFGGRLPDAGELAAIERRLARDLEALRPDPDAERRGALKLRSRPRPAPITPKETPG